MILYALLDLTNSIMLKREMHEVHEDMKNAIIEIDVEAKDEQIN